MSAYPSSFQTLCLGLNLRLTSLRREVLYILWKAKKPLKAYEVLDCLLKTKPNAKAPSVYRALEFFLALGIVHKIDSIQSYTLCVEPEKQLCSELLLVCNQCHKVSEVHDHTLQALLLEITDQYQFKLKQDAVELKGVCAACASSHVV